MSDLSTARLRQLLDESPKGPWRVFDGCSWRRILTADTQRPVIVPEASSVDRHPDLGGGLPGHGVYPPLELAALAPELAAEVIALRARAEKAEAERDAARANLARLVAYVDDAKDNVPRNIYIPGCRLPTLVQYMADEIAKGDAAQAEVARLRALLDAQPDEAPLRPLTLDDAVAELERERVGCIENAKHAQVRRQVGAAGMWDDRANYVQVMIELLTRTGRYRNLGPIPRAPNEPGGGLAMAPHEAPAHGVPTEPGDYECNGVRLGLDAVHGHRAGVTLATADGLFAVRVYGKPTLWALAQAWGPRVGSPEEPSR